MMDRKIYGAGVKDKVVLEFFFSSRRRHTRWTGDWSSDVCSSACHHDERVVTGEAVGSAGPGLRAVRRGLGLDEVRRVDAGPRLLLLVPPDVLLALAPGLALGVGGGAVVEDAAVVRPGPAPLLGRRALLAAGLAVRRPVDAPGVDAGVDPAAAAGGAVGLEIGVHAGQLARLVAGQVPPVDLLQDGLATDLAVLVEGV